MYWSALDNDQCATTPYAGTITAMGNADAQHLAVLDAKLETSTTAIIQYTDCSAEYLDLALLGAVGSPCTDRCTECCGSKSTVVPAKGKRRMWVLNSFNSDAIRASRHTLDAEPATTGKARKSKGGSSRRAGGAQAALQGPGVGESSSGDDETLAQAATKKVKHLRRAAGAKPGEPKRRTRATRAVAQGVASSPSGGGTVARAGPEVVAKQQARKRRAPHATPPESKDSEDDVPLQLVLLAASRRRGK